MGPHCATSLEPLELMRNDTDNPKGPLRCESVNRYLNEKKLTKTSAWDVIYVNKKIKIFKIYM